MNLITIGVTHTLHKKVEKKKFSASLPKWKFALFYINLEVSVFNECYTLLSLPIRKKPHRQHRRTVSVAINLFRRVEIINLRIHTPKHICKQSHTTKNAEQLKTVARRALITLDCMNGANERLLFSAQIALSRRQKRREMGKLEKKNVRVKSETMSEQFEYTEGKKMMREEGEREQGMKEDTSGRHQLELKMSA